MVVVMVVVGVQEPRRSAALQRDRVTHSPACHAGHDHGGSYRSCCRIRRAHVRGCARRDGVSGPAAAGRKPSEEVVRGNVCLPSGMCAIDCPDCCARARTQRPLHSLDLAPIALLLQLSLIGLVVPQPAVRRARRWLGLFMGLLPPPLGTVHELQICNTLEPCPSLPQRAL